MADVVISDPGAGVVDVETYVNRSLVVGSHLYMDVIQGPTQVSVKGIGLFLRLHVRWNGGTSNPTIISANPVAFWSVRTINIVYHGNLSIYEWMIYWSHTVSAPTFLPQITPILGTTARTVSNSSWTQYVDYDYYGLITYQSGGSGVLPPANEESMIIL